MNILIFVFSSTTPPPVGVFCAFCCQANFRTLLFVFCFLSGTVHFVWQNKTWMDGATLQNNRQSRCVFVLLYKKSSLKLFQNSSMFIHTNVNPLFPSFFIFLSVFIFVCLGNSEEFKSTQYMFCIALYLRWIKCLHHLLLLFFFLLPEWMHAWIKECSYWSPGQSIICHALHCFSRCNSLYMFSS